MSLRTTPGAQPASEPTPEPPSLAWSILFGFFGAVPSAKKARRLGHPTGRYYSAAAITTFVVPVLFCLAVIGLFAQAISPVTAPAASADNSGKSASTQQGTEAPADLAAANETASDSLAKTTSEAVAALSACDPKKAYMAKETFERDGLILPRQHIDDYPQAIIADQAAIEKAAFNCADPRYLEYSTAIFVPGKQRRIESGMNYEIYRFDAINGTTLDGDTMVAKGVRIFKRVDSPETLREPYTYTYKWNGEFWIITDAIQGSN